MLENGQRFERLTIIGITFYISPATGRKYKKYKVICDCGNKRVVAAYDLNTGKVKSCGCLSRERVTKHGRHKSRVYKIWRDMKARCNNANDTSYSYYGERGIKVCKRWQKFDNFLKDMGEPPTNKHTIDRINTDGDYKPSNCRWATRSEQQQNRRPFKQWNQNLTDEQIKEIKYSSLRQVEIAKKFQVSEQYVSRIKKGLRHKHL